MATNRVVCFYHPKCVETFANTFGMKRHCMRTHKGENRIFCPECETLTFFASKRSLANHMVMHTSKVACEFCDKLCAPTYLPKHRAKCRQEAEESTEDVASAEVDTVVSQPIVQVYHPQPTGLTRSSHAAPSSRQTEENMKEFVEWLKSPTAVGKKTSVRDVTGFINKFRTILGKLAKHHELTTDQLFYRLNRSNSCGVLVEPATLNKFFMSLAKADDGRPLQASTLYNYVRTLVVYFQWKTFGLGKSEFATTLKSIEQVQQNLNFQKRNLQRNVDKHARFSNFPSVPEIVDFMETELRPKADAARVAYESAGFASWEVYEALRNYILFALLIAVPTQRLQVYDELSVDDIAYKSDYSVLVLKKHKTDYKYGPVVIALQPHYLQVFKAYLEARSDVAAFACKNLFVGRDGKKEKYLTKRFQAITSAKYSMDIGIRDCRTLFVTWASDHLDLTQRYELSRTMCHSFQMQQSSYRVEDPVNRAMRSTDTVQALNALNAMDAHNPVTRFLPLCNADLMDIEEIDEDNEEEESKTQDPFEDVPDDLLLQAMDEYESQQQ